MVNSLNQSLKNNLSQNIKKQKIIAKKIYDFPKGCLCLHTIKSKNYYYLCYRTSSGVVKDYVGTPDSEPVKRMRTMIKKRKELVIQLRELKKEAKLISRLLNLF